MGANFWGQLGTGTYYSSSRPVLVDTSGALPGKTVVEISAGHESSWALAADGALCGWGRNDAGQLGNGTYATAGVPVPVYMLGALAGHRVFALPEAGSRHMLAIATAANAIDPQGAGFWKNRPELWLVAGLPLGSESYTQAELLTLLSTPVGAARNADASLILAHQLIATKLNLAVGCDASSIGATVNHADGLLSGFAGKLPYGVAPSSAAGSGLVRDAEILDNYNKGLLPERTPVYAFTTLAGTSGATGTADGVGSLAQFTQTNALALAGDGSLFVGDIPSIRRVTPAGAVTTFAPIGAWGVAVDSSGNVFTTSAQTAIYKINALREREHLRRRVRLRHRRRRRNDRPI